MPRSDDTLEEWIKIFEPKRMKGSVGYDGGPVPVYRFLLELVEVRKRIASIDAPDVDYSQLDEREPA